MTPEHSASTPAWIETSALTAPALLGASAGLLLGEWMHRSARRGVGIGLGALGVAMLLPFVVGGVAGLVTGPKSKVGVRRKHPTHPRRRHRRAGLRRSGRRIARARVDLTSCGAQPSRLCCQTGVPPVLPRAHRRPTSQQPGTDTGHDSHAAGSARARLLGKGGRDVHPPYPQQKAAPREEAAWWEKFVRCAVSWRRPPR